MNGLFSLPQTEIHEVCGLWAGGPSSAGQLIPVKLFLHFHSCPLPSCFSLIKRRLAAEATQTNQSIIKESKRVDGIGVELELNRAKQP